MMKKVFLFLLLFVPGLISGQKKIVSKSLEVAPLYPLNLKNTSPKISPSVPPVFLLSSAPKVTNWVGSDEYYQQCFGYFCKREWNWEKQTRVPIKLRLGSYQEAQRLEGKQ